MIRCVAERDGSLPEGATVEAHSHALTMVDMAHCACFAAVS